MKKLLSILLAISMCFSLAACGSGDSRAPDVKDEPAGLVYPFNIVNQPMDIGSAYEYETICSQDTSLETKGYVYIKDYSVTPVEGEEGMVDKSVTAGFIFNDDNAWYNGMKFDILYADIKGDGLIDDDGEEWTAEIDGKEYPMTIIKDEFSGNEWLPNAVFVSYYDLTIRMPEGYDDIALFFYNSQQKQNILPEGGALPAGTEITSLVDSHSQWFILGGEDGTYYGNPVEFGTSAGNPEDIINNHIYDGEAPPPIYSDEDLPDDIGMGEEPDNLGFVYVEIDDWSHDSVKRDEKMGVRINFSAYNTAEGDYVIAQAFVDGTGEPIFERKVDAYNPDYSIFSDVETFVIDGPSISPDAASVNFRYTLYDATGNELSCAMMDLPFEEETATEEAFITLVSCTPEEINKGETQQIDVSYKVEGYSPEMTIMYSVKDGTDGDPIDFGDIKAEAEGTISTPLSGATFANDFVHVRIRLLNGYGDDISVVECDIPVK